MKTPDFASGQIAGEVTIDPLGLLPSQAWDGIAQLDLFDVAAVSDKAAPIVANLFTSCETIEKGTLGWRERRRDFVSMPEVAIAADQRFTLTRSKLKNKETLYRFQRIDGPEDNGFSLIKNEAGITLLQNKGPESTPVDSEHYLQLILQASKFLAEYAEAVGVSDFTIGSTKNLLPGDEQQIMTERKLKPAKRTHPVLITIGKGALALSSFAALPVAGYYAMNTVANHVTAAAGLPNANNAPSNAPSNTAGERQQLANLSQLSKVVGEACMRALTPYHNELINVPVTDAATQLVRDNVCDQPGTNTQLVVQNFRDYEDALSADTRPVEIPLPVHILPTYDLIKTFDGPIKLSFDAVGILLGAGMALRISTALIDSMDNELSRVMIGTSEHQD